MDAQNMKTRGQNPNPTTQAQSKRCLPPSTKTQNIKENAVLGAPVFTVFCYFFLPFSHNLFEGVPGTSQSAEIALNNIPQSRK